MEVTEVRGFAFVNLRREKGYSVDQICRELDVPTPTWHKWEAKKGDTVRLHRKYRAVIGEALRDAGIIDPANDEISLPRLREMALPKVPRKLADLMGFLSEEYQREILLLAAKT